MDGQEDTSVYTGPALDLSRKWSGSACSPAGTGCGTAGNPGHATSTYARVAVNNDDLYFFVHIRDDYQSYAVTPGSASSTGSPTRWSSSSIRAASRR